jgi:hypothetical protein
MELTAARRGAKLQRAAQLVRSMRGGRMRRMGMVLLVAGVMGVLSATGSPGAPAGAGSSSTQLQLVHGVGTVPGDNPVDVYVAPGGASVWDIVAGGPMAYTDTREVLLAGGTWSVLLCDAVPDPAPSLDGCPEGSLNAGGTSVAVPESSDAVLVAGYAPPEGEELSVVLDLFEVDTSCLFVDQARFQVGHAAAIGNVTLFIDGARDGREPIGNGESVSAGLPQGAYDLLMVTEGDEYFVLDEPDVPATAGTVTFLALVGPGDPTPLDPATTDLRFVPVEVAAPLCPEPPAPSTTETTAPDPEPPAPPQPAPADFTG